MTETPVTPFDLPRPWETVSIGLASFLSYLLFAYLLGEGRGTIAGAFLGAFALTVRASSPLRQKFWFWLAILVLAALHIFVVTAFSWSAAAHWTGLTLMPFMAADIGLLLAIVLFIYRLVYGSPARLFTSPEKRYAEDVE